MYRFGWWTTGRDEAAVELLKTVLDAINQDVIKGEISYVFISREKGESRYSDEIIEISQAKAIPCVSFSAKKFKPELRKTNRELWRDEYHDQVLQLVTPYEADLIVLAGYMWVVSASACERLKLINLHPALPGGPEGTWQEVIWKLIKEDHDKTGAMMHLVTPELDKGPPVTYFSFPIKGHEWDDLWQDFAERLKKAGSFENLVNTIGEQLPLFKKIREEGVKRELPLIVNTMRAFSLGEISLSDLKEPREIICDDISNNAQ
ncbi:Phosphoribosylglycinamide formyltransferase [Dissulfuribacter thermophilus]|uniref:phosphoribosylglycinamide formyltransferase 1 n=1 Tax=Dissulfuribacter thermophilus TaxID=1156395 RepID=A0A1B9F651_9BACT|nr:formyltransferase family protein [Dissulfuribacter thermophilus]OCC15285.1 Phosphoribosylglycinamide formyltransferase [Dissulfuribacter thermophilus]